MEAVCEGHDLIGSSGIGIIWVDSSMDTCPLASKLDGALVSLCASVAEKGLVAEGVVYQALGQVYLRMPESSLRWLVSVVMRRRRCCFLGIGERKTGLGQRAGHPGMEYCMVVAYRQRSLCLQLVCGL